MDAQIIDTLEDDDINQKVQGSTAEEEEEEVNDEEEDQNDKHRKDALNALRTIQIYCEHLDEIPSSLFKNICDITAVLDRSRDDLR